MKNLITIDFKPESKVGCKLHSIATHNYYIEKGIQCPYCLIGSEPVHKSLLEEEDWVKEV